MNRIRIASLLLALLLLSGCGQAAAPAASQSAEPQDYYAVCTNFSKSDVEQFASEVREMILSSDWAGLSKVTACPITVGGVTYQTGDALAAAPFETLLDAPFLKAVEEASCVDLFCNADGVMLGNGEVWIAEVLDENLQSKGLFVTALNVSAPEPGIKAGTWLAYGAGEYTYYFFDADGASGRTRSQSAGIGLPFTYELSGDAAVFCMGSADSRAPATLHFEDSDHFTLQWSEGIAEELCYISEEGSDTFAFFSDDELCELALAYYQAHADSGEDFSGLLAGAETGEDGLVTIQVYKNLTGHNSTCAWYAVDRQSAEGTDVTTGERVCLAPVE